MLLSIPIFVAYLCNPKLVPPTPKCDLGSTPTCGLFDLQRTIECWRRNSYAPGISLLSHTLVIDINPGSEYSTTIAIRRPSSWA